MAHKNVPGKLGLEAGYPGYFYGEQSPGYEGMFVKQDGIEYEWVINHYELVE